MDKQTFLDKQTFRTLPPAIALGLVWDLIGGKLQTIEAPKVPFPPKFDSRVSKKGGYHFASELDLGSLRYFQKRAADSAADGGEYAERNLKDSESLGYWVRYRECFPDAIWSGERNKQKVTAAPPSRDPGLHQWEAKPGAPARSGTSSGGYGTETAKSGGYGDDTDDIPF
jgi:hypothetical protein